MKIHYFIIYILLVISLHDNVIATELNQLNNIFDPIDYILNSISYTKPNYLFDDNGNQQCNVSISQNFVPLNCNSGWHCIFNPNTFINNFNIANILPNWFVDSGDWRSGDHNQHHHWATIFSYGVDNVDIHHDTPFCMDIYTDIIARYQSLIQSALPCTEGLVGSENINNNLINFDTIATTIESSFLNILQLCAIIHIHEQANSVNYSTGKNVFSIIESVANCYLLAGMIASDVSKKQYYFNKSIEWYSKLILSSNNATINFIMGDQQKIVASRIILILKAAVESYLQLLPNNCNDQKRIAIFECIMQLDNTMISNQSSVLPYVSLLLNEDICSVIDMLIHHAKSYFIFSKTFTDSSTCSTYHENGINFCIEIGKIIDSALLQSSLLLPKKAKLLRLKGDNNSLMSDHSMNSDGQAYVDKAITDYEQAINIFSQLGNDSVIQQAEIYRKLAGLVAISDSRKINWFQQAIQMFNSIQPSTIDSYHGVARCYFEYALSLNNSNNAKIQYQNAIVVYENLITYLKQLSNTSSLTLSQQIDLIKAEIFLLSVYKKNIVFSLSELSNLNQSEINTQRQYIDKFSKIYQYLNVDLGVLMSSQFVVQTNEVFLQLIKIVSSFGEDLAKFNLWIASYQRTMSNYYSIFVLSINDYISAGDLYNDKLSTCIASNLFSNITLDHAAFHKMQTYGKALDSYIDLFKENAVNKSMYDVLYNQDSANMFAWLLVFFASIGNSQIASPTNSLYDMYTLKLYSVLWQLSSINPSFYALISGQLMQYSNYDAAQSVTSLSDNNALMAYCVQQFSSSWTSFVSKCSSQILSTDNTMIVNEPFNQFLIASGYISFNNNNDNNLFTYSHIINSLLNMRQLYSMRSMLPSLSANYNECSCLLSSMFNKMSICLQRKYLMASTMQSDKNIDIVRSCYFAFNSLYYLSNKCIDDSLIIDESEKAVCKKNIFDVFNKMNVQSSLKSFSLKLQKKVMKLFLMCQEDNIPNDILNNIYLNLIGDEYSIISIADFFISIANMFHDNGDLSNEKKMYVFISKLCSRLINHPFLKLHKGTIFAVDYYSKMLESYGVLNANNTNKINNVSNKSNNWWNSYVSLGNDFIQKLYSDLSGTMIDNSLNASFHSFMKNQLNDNNDFDSGDDSNNFLNNFNTDVLDSNNINNSVSSAMSSANNAVDAALSADGVQQNISSGNSGDSDVISFSALNGINNASGFFSITNPLLSDDNKSTSRELNDQYVWSIYRANSYRIIALRLLDSLKLSDDLISLFNKYCYASYSWYSFALSCDGIDNLQTSYAQSGVNWSLGQLGKKNVKLSNSLQVNTVEKINSTVSQGSDNQSLILQNWQTSLGSFSNCYYDYSKEHNRLFGSGANNGIAVFSEITSCNNGLAFDNMKLNAIRMNEVLIGIATNSMYEKTVSKANQYKTIFDKYTYVRSLYEKGLTSAQRFCGVIIINSVENQLINVQQHVTQSDIASIQVSPCATGNKLQNSMSSVNGYSGQGIGFACAEGYVDHGVLLQNGITVEKKVQCGYFSQDATAEQLKEVVTFYINDDTSSHNLLCEVPKIVMSYDDGRSFYIDKLVPGLQKFFSSDILQQWAIVAEFNGVNTSIIGVVKCNAKDFPLHFYNNGLTCNDCDVMSGVVNFDSSVLLNLHSILTQCIPIGISTYSFMNKVVLCSMNNGFCDLIQQAFTGKSIIAGNNKFQEIENNVGDEGAFSEILPIFQRRKLLFFKGLDLLLSDVFIKKSDLPSIMQIVQNLTVPFLNQKRYIVGVQIPQNLILSLQ